MAELPKGMHLPIPDAETETFWKGTREGKLFIKKCRACRRCYFYPRHYCPRCWSQDTEWMEASGKGVVYSYTIIHHHDIPPFKDMLPYVVALVELEEGVRLTTNIVECDLQSLRVGLPVEVTFDPVTEEITLPKFRPVLSKE